MKCNAMRVVFLDRDGVINRKRREGDYVKSWEKLEFLPGAQEAIRGLNDHDFRVIVTTNERCVSLGKIEEGQLRMIHKRLMAELRRQGAWLDAIHYCPHDYNSCACRKPGVGMYLQAQRDFPGLTFTSAFVMGDSITDMQAAVHLGCRRILMAPDDSKLPRDLQRGGIEIDFVANSLRDAVFEFLLKERQQISS